jgi:hypothetical protein
MSRPVYHSGLFFSLILVSLDEMTVSNTAQQVPETFSIDMYQVLMIAGFEIDIGKTG